MAIHFVTGVPGAGKSRYAMALLCKELRLGKRTIVTNLAVQFMPWINGAGDAMKGLLEYLRQTYNGETFDAENRVRIITDDQCRSFFCYRQKGVDCDLIYEDKKPVGFNTEQIRGGVFYILDEVWKFFGAREWQNTTKAVQFYAAQHRKFGDDVIMCTQKLKQVDSAIRDLAEDYRHVVNHGKRRMGIFRQPEGFSVKIYSDPPTSILSQPMHTEYFKLDVKGLAQTYDTSGGVGIVGRHEADVNARKTGLSWAWALPAVGIAASAFFFIPDLIGKGLGWGTSVKGDIPVRATNAPPRRPVIDTPVETDVTLRNIHQKPNVYGASLNRPPELPEPEPVYLTGYLRSGKQVMVYLSDGRYYSEKSPHLRFLGDGFVVIGTNTFRFKPTVAEPDDSRHNPSKR